MRGQLAMEERLSDTESRLKLKPAPEATLGDALDTVFKAVRFVWSRVFDEKGLELVPSLWPRLERLLLERLKAAVPDTWEALGAFSGLVEKVRLLEESVADWGLVGSDRILSDVVVNAEESFAHKVRVQGAKVH